MKHVMFLGIIGSIEVVWNKTVTHIHVVILCPLIHSESFYLGHASIDPFPSRIFSGLRLIGPGTHTEPEPCLFELLLILEAVYT